MKDINKILLPINIGWYTDDSVDFSITLAQAYHAELLLVHVIENDFDSEEVKDIALKSANKHLKKIQTVIEKTGVKIGLSTIKYGRIADIITTSALRNNVNFILIGIKKPKTQGEYLLDNNIERVINQTVKPVWVIRDGDKHKIENILCPFDLSKESKHSLNNSIHLAQKFNSKLTILNVYSTISNKFPLISGDFSLENDKSFRKSRDRINLFLRNFEYPKIYWKAKFRVGDPSIEIINECKEFNYDLLIMGSAGLKGLGNLMMGSVTARVIRHAPCSFIVTKTEDILNLQLETKINTINFHYNLAKQNFKAKLYEEAINEYFICLANSNMHIPSLLGLSEVYKSKGDKQKAEAYRKLAMEILDKLNK